MMRARMEKRCRMSLCGVGMGSACTFLTHTVDTGGEVGGDKPPELHIGQALESGLVAGFGDVAAVCADEMDMVGFGHLIQRVMGIDEKPAQNAALAKQLHSVVDSGAADMEIAVYCLVELVNLEMRIEALRHFEYGEALGSFPEPFGFDELSKHFLHFARMSLGNFPRQFCAKIIGGV